MKNIDVIKSLPSEALALLLIKEDAFISSGLFISLSGESFDSYDDAVKDCVTWLNASCE